MLADSPYRIAALLTSYYELPSSVSTQTPTRFPTRLTGKRLLLQGPSPPIRSDAEVSQYGATYGNMANVGQQYPRGRSRAHNGSITQRNRISQQRKCRIDRELALTFLTEDRLLRYSPSRGLATHGTLNYRFQVWKTLLTLPFYHLTALLPCAPIEHTKMISR